MRLCCSDSMFCYIPSKIVVLFYFRWQLTWLDSTFKLCFISNSSNFSSTIIIYSYVLCLHVWRVGQDVGRIYTEICRELSASFSSLKVTPFHFSGCDYPKQFPSFLQARESASSPLVFAPCTELPAASLQAKSWGNGKHTPCPLFLPVIHSLIELVCFCSFFGCFIFYRGLINLTCVIIILVGTQPY